ncbi:MAG TPA: penicillin-binding protein 2 [Gemmatimonadaceae bacterium]|nr:penicillin-binding protein 2 [Acidimicrobiia bacterium]
MIRSKRIGLAHATLAIFALAILIQSARVQLAQGKAWRARAERQQTTERTVPAPRGDILDATHHVLAQSREVVRLEIAPREVKEPRKLRKALTQLHVDAATIARALDTSVKYLTVPGRFVAVDAAPAIALRGVRSFASITRAYGVSEGTQGILGHVDADNKPVDGLELALDSILRGTPGAATIFRDPKGQVRESPTAPGTAPIRGSTVVLTINADLQQIAEKALADAVARMGAEGGDIVILDPHDGDILAMASRRLDPRQTAATALTEPFEPGSTAKPFMAAGLLERGLVSDRDSVDTGDGVYAINGREIHDEHHVGRASLADVLRWSSNIGIVKFSQRLSNRQEFETLRDFGFGTPTGVPFPTESGGILRVPKTWSLQSANSMAMGYEISVTPLQLATAYAAFANGGELVEPALLKEVIGPDGSVRYRHERRVVRRVMSRPVADKIRHMLLDIVDEGTALQAALENYLLAGKTGTPRSTVRGHYVAGRYNPNFVGLFPGDAPQYVIVVKLTAPQSSIFAAETAAPVTKAILEAAVAAGNAALDRSKLASSVVPSRKDTARHMTIEQAGTSDKRVAETPVDDSADPHESVPFVVTLPIQPPAPPPRTVRPVPDVRGLALRDAVRSLHSAGFRVQLGRGGTSGSAVTTPAAGELAQTGTLVRLLFDY